MPQRFSRPGESATFNDNSAPRPHFRHLLTCDHFVTISKIGAVVVAQLIERLLPTPEVSSLHPVIGNCLFGTFVNCQL